MESVQINGILVGARSVVLSVVTTNPGNLSIHYKVTGSSGGWTPVNCVEGTNLFFRENAWEVDLEKCFLQGTSYDLFARTKDGNNNVDTETYQFTTESVGVFGSYLLEYCSRDNHVQRIPTAAEEAYYDGDADHPGIVRVFITKLEDIGFNMSYFRAEHSGYEPSFHIADDLAPGVAGITTGGIAGECYFSNDDIDIHSLIHEYRHCFFFNSNADEGFIGNAKDIQPEIFRQMDSADYYKVFSFFALNGNTSEPYNYYGENSCENESRLYDYFILKLLALNPLTIIEG